MCLSQLNGSSPSEEGGSHIEKQREDSARGEEVKVIFLLYQSSKEGVRAGDHGIEKRKM